MNDMSSVITPRSDQINADSLLSGPITITIIKVDIKAGAEQPITISYKGGEGKPWRPCKSMARCLVAAWGNDSSKYIGRSLTLYCDPKVKWGGMEVGGIRISNMSDISGPMTMALTSTRAVKKPFTVKPLVLASKPSFDALLADIKAAQDIDTLESTYKEAYKLFKDESQRAQLIAAKDARKAELTTTPQEPKA